MQIKSYSFYEKFLILLSINLIANLIKLLSSNVYIQFFAICMQIIYIVLGVKLIIKEVKEWT